MLKSATTVKIALDPMVLSSLGSHMEDLSVVEGSCIFVQFVSTC